VVLSPIQKSPCRFEDIKIKSPSIKSSNSGICSDLKTREDFLNFSIENVWKEMEEL